MTGGRHLTLIGILTWGVILFTSIGARGAVWFVCMFVFVLSTNTRGDALERFAHATRTRLRILFERPPADATVLAHRRSGATSPTSPRDRRTITSVR